MTPEQLEHYLYEQIPVSKSLAIGVHACSPEKIQLIAPLDVNVNHKNTAFGGSLSVIAILAGWSLVFMRLQGIPNEIVIQDSHIKYLKAVTDDFSAISLYQPSSKWVRFFRTFEKRGKGRVEVQSHLYCDHELVAEFTGVYVAFNQSI